MGRRLVRLTRVCPAAALLVPAALAAQAPTTSLTLTITANDTGQPLANVAVSVDSARTTLTDVNGRVYIGDIPPGRHSVRVEAFGYHTERLDILFVTSHPVTGNVALLTEAVAVQPLYVVVEGKSYLERAGFYQRKKRGMGKFVEEAKIHEMVERGGKLSDALRGMRGIRVVPWGYGYTLQATRGGSIGNANPLATGRSTGLGNGPCRPKVYLDGLEMDSDNIDLIAPLEWITAIEVYAGPSETPARYMMLAPCGVVLLWTRR